MAAMRRLGFSTTVLSVLSIVLAAPLAHAAGKEAKERAARKACLSGNYVKGVDLLSDLLIDTNDVNYIFNQARCFEQNSRYTEAAGRFREYLRKASGLSPEDKADTEKHIADCQALIEPKPTPEPVRVVSTPKSGVAPVDPTPAATPAAPSPAPAAMLPAPLAGVAAASAPRPATNPG